MLEEDGGTIEADYTTTPEPYGNALSQHRSGDSSFYLWDGIRNVRQLTDGAEVVTDCYGFDGWGPSTGSSGSTANTQQWQGQSIAYRKDADAGPESQYAMHHRNYNPRSGVFTAADPAKDDLNLYRYVHNNPVNRDDPSGLFALPDDSGSTLLELQEKFARTKAQLQKANEALEEESQKCFLTHSEERANELFAHSDYLRRRLWEIRDEIQQKHNVTVSTRERKNATTDPYIAVSRLSAAEKVAAFLRILGVSYPGQRTTFLDREAPPITESELARAGLLIAATSELAGSFARYLDREITNAWLGLVAGAKTLNNLTLPPTDRSTGYWNQVGIILKGEGKSVWNTAAGLVGALGSPLQTLDAIWHPGTTFRSMAESAHDRSVKLEGQGEVIGEILQESFAEAFIGKLLKSANRGFDFSPPPNANQRPPTCRTAPAILRLDRQQRTWMH